MTFVRSTAAGGASSSPQLPIDRLIVALDVPSQAAAIELAGRLQGICRWVKVGMELYYSAGNAVVEDLRKRGFDVFLDLKLHDIPNTVAGAVRSVSGAGASLLTVHAGGGAAMLEAAANAASSPGAPRLLAVTVLTSMDAVQLRGVGVEGAPAEQVVRLAKLGTSCGISGFVCSPEEVGELRSELGEAPLLVTPGIRPAGSEIGDQRRVATPAMAIRFGASMLVVGRPITQAEDPGVAAESILREMSSV
jgi:orotidine-5'-phosphate decarboxylase